MKSHDISKKLRDLIKQLRVSLKSSDGKLLVTLTSFLTELQMMAEDPNPQRVAKILSLILELGKRVTESERNEES